MVLGVVRPEMASVPRSRTDVDKGAIYTLFLRLLKIVPTFVLDRKCPCVICIKFA